MRHRYVTPLRYPGGKARLSTFIEKLLVANRLDGGTYVEVFAGGAGVATSLVVSGAVRRAHINDIDPGVYAFWRTVVDSPDDLCRRVLETRLDVDEWRRQRRVQQDAAGHSVEALAFSTLFLNRVNRSGIIASGGIIGGIRQRGEWKLDARFNRRELVVRIGRIAKEGHRLRVHNEDALRFLRRMLPRLSERTLIYLDPPYYVKGSRRLYANYYGHEDHASIADTMRTAKLPWVVSYDDVPQVRTLYAGLRSRRLTLTYTANDRYDAAERLYFSADLRVPRTIAQ